MSFENVQLLYEHPHVAVYVEDNSGYTPTYLEPEVPVRMLQCGQFAQGRDNKLVYCESYEQLINEFGKPNYRLYGQAGYNVARALKTGYCAAYVMRVMPDDATFANTIVMLRYKVITDIDGNNSLSVSFTSKSVENAFTVEAIRAEMNRLSSTDPDEDGYFYKPLFCVYAAGRGLYGNTLRFRFADVTNYENTFRPTVRDYRFDVLMMEDTLVRKEYVFGCFDETAFDIVYKESLYLQDLINDEESGLGKVRIMINTEAFEEVLNVYNTQVLPAGEEPTTIGMLDLIYGLDNFGNTNKYITFEPSPDEISFRAETDGVMLSGGSEGSFDINAEGRDDAIEEMLVRAYAGHLDRLIKSSFSTPVDFMLDANFPDAVKRQMAALAMARQYDCTCYLDAGLLDTTTETLYWLALFENIAHPNVNKETHHYKYRDLDYTGKLIDVTTTFYLAGLIPTHFKEVGLGSAMACANAIVTEAVKGSFLPVIDPEDHDIKKEYFRLRGNYYETIRYGVQQRGTATNSQLEVTDRSDEFNNYILNLAVQTARDIMYGHIYNFAEPEDRARYQNTTNDTLQNKLGAFVRSCTVEYEMSKDDEKRNILRLKIRIVYKTVVKRGIVEVYLDPRVVD